ncbi:MAG TPA: hypothetical protein VFT42_09625 [Solirubrobacteraceae bacterium]|nr:hypothetical protein [Solirubrobacteraceae bacterium]
MRPVPYVAAAILGVAASVAVGCGTTNRHLIPSGASGALQNDFQRVANAVDAGHCQAAAQAVQDAYNDYANLPTTVDPRLRRRLKDGIDNLARRAPAQCTQAQTQPQTVTTETTTTQTETTPPPTTTTQTQTTTTPTTTTGTTTTPPPTTTTNNGGAGAGDGGGAGAGVTTTTPGGG